MNSLLGVVLFSIGMSIFAPLFMKFLKNLSPEESHDTDPDEFVLRPKKGSNILIGILWNAVWGGFTYVCYMVFGKLKYSIPVLIVILICFSCVGFYVILSTIPGLNETTVSSEQITVKRFFYSAQITFADIRSYRYLDKAQTWIVYTNKKPKKLWFDSLTTNADLFLRKLQEHEIEEEYPFKDVDKYAFSKKYSKFHNRIFAMIIPFEIIGMFFFARTNFCGWKNNKTLRVVITTYYVVWYYVFPIYSILSGLICLRGKYDGWKPEDSVDKDVRINSAIVFIAMMIGFIIFYYWGELARENGIRIFSGMQI